MAIKIKDLNYKDVLTNVNVDIKEGEITTIIGPRGGGKTTLLDLIKGLKKPTSGVIKTKYNKDKIGLVFQFPEDQFFKNMVYDEIVFAIDNQNLTFATKKEKVINSLKMVGLNPNYLTKDPFLLSSGEKRKIAIASILVTNPKIILLDEPTVGLDDQSIKSFIRQLNTLKTKYNKTIVIVSHDIEFVHQTADNVIVLNKEVKLSDNKFQVFKQEKKLNKEGIKVPKIMEFINKVESKKKIKLRDRVKTNDLIKDIYSHV